MNRYFKKIMLGIFFISGFASLIYQIVWSRMLIYIFGNTTHSISVVISIFMLGLATGSYVLGKVADRNINLLRLYAFLEAMIGIFGFISYYLVRYCERLFVNYSDVFVSKNVNEIIIKVIISTLILFPPTFFMGGTLPVLIRFFNNLYGDLSKQTGKLYGFNTLGAVFGVMLTGFIFIEFFGLIVTLYVAVGLNFLIAVISYLYSINFKFHYKSGVKISTNIHSQVLVKYSNLKIYLLITTYAVSGFIALSYEVLWTRLITPASGIYIYGFSFMLAMFLLGLALGSFIYEKYFSEKFETFLFIGFLQVILSFFAFCVVVFVSFFIPLWTKYVYRLVVPIIVFIPPTIVMGMMFPAITAVFSGSDNIGKKIGTVYAFNSFGSIIGAFVAGFILIPIIGTVQSVLILAIFSALLGLFMLILTSQNPYKVVFIGVAALIVAINMFGLYNSQSIFLPRLVKQHIKDYTNRDQKLKFTVKEDSVASLLVINGDNNTQNINRALYIDGVETTGLVEETKLMAHLPLLIHPHPTDVLVIAFGMGSTFRSVLAYPDTYADVVELVPSVPAFMPKFHNDGKSVLSNLRGKVIINDGRNYVLVTKKKYDVITIDPPPPTNGAGTTVLFSDEFYKNLKKIIKENGIIQSWIVFDLNSNSTKMMTETFRKNFKYIQLYKSPADTGIFMIGSDVPVSLDNQRVKKITAIPSVSKDMSEWSSSVYTYEYLNGLYVGSEKELANFSQGSSTITDYFPRTEFSLIRNIVYSQPVISMDDFLEGIK